MVVLLTSRFPSLNTRLTGGVCANDNTTMQQLDTDILASREKKKKKVRKINCCHEQEEHRGNVRPAAWFTEDVSSMFNKDI